MALTAATASPDALTSLAVSLRPDAAVQRKLSNCRLILVTYQHTCRPGLSIRTLSLCPREVGFQHPLLNASNKAAACDSSKRRRFGATNKVEVDKFTRIVVNG